MCLFLSVCLLSVILMGSATHGYGGGLMGYILGDVIVIYIFYFFRLVLIRDM